jgi:hypothetical protein
MVQSWGGYQFILPGKGENGMPALSCRTLCRFVYLLSRALSEMHNYIYVSVHGESSVVSNIKKSEESAFDYLTVIHINYERLTC